MSEAIFICQPEICRQFWEPKTPFLFTSYYHWASSVVKYPFKKSNFEDRRILALTLDNISCKQFTFISNNISIIIIIPSKPRFSSPSSYAGLCLKPSWASGAWHPGPTQRKNRKKLYKLESSSNHHIHHCSKVFWCCWILTGGWIWLVLAGQVDGFHGNVLSSWQNSLQVAKFYLVWMRYRCHEEYHGNPIHSLTTTLGNGHCL